MTEEEMQAKIAELENEKTKLKTKNAELVDREKAAKTKATEAEEAAEAAAAAAAEKAGDIEAIKASIEKKHKAELTKRDSLIAERDGQIAKLNGDLGTLKIDNVIQEAITKNGVLPHHADVLATFLRNGVTMENGEAMAGERSLADHLGAFFTSDAAAHYVAAPANSGAGATGSTSTAVSGPITDASAFMKLAKENPEAAKAADVDPSLSYLKNVL